MMQLLPFSFNISKLRSHRGDSKYLHTFFLPVHWDIQAVFFPRPVYKDSDEEVWRFEGAVAVAAL